MTTLREAAQQALEAMKMAAELQEDQRIDFKKYGLKQDEDIGVKYEEAITALRDVLAQEEQEPVLVVEKEPDYMSRGHFYEGRKPFIDPTEVWKLPIGTKLYTQPPRREWRGLTEEEIIEAVRESDLDWHRGWTLEDGESNRYTKLACTLDGVLKEKNHG